MLIDITIILLQWSKFSLLNFSGTLFLNLVP
jgi:hypothetical protein